MQIKDKKIGVLMGGVSAERDISLKTGKAVVRALNRLGYQTVEMDVKGSYPRFTFGTVPSSLRIEERGLRQKPPTSNLQPLTKYVESGLSPVSDIKLGTTLPIDSKICTRLLDESIDVAFIALHGRYGEDGTIQGLLEIMRIPYTGSGVAASALAMNKVITKMVFQSQGIPTPPYKLLFIDDEGELTLSFQNQSLKQGCTVEGSSLEKKLQSGRGNSSLSVIEESAEFGQGFQAEGSGGLLNTNFPMVVKPPSEGSTIGVRVVHDEYELREAIDEVRIHSSQILMERFIDGSEVTVGILEGELLPTIEIVPKKGFYDYTSKYTPGMTEYIIPTSLDKKTDEEVQKLALEAYRTLGCRGSARVDIIVDKSHNPWVLEINTIPGMTETSLLPKAAQFIDITFDSVVERMLCGARLGD